MADVSDLPTSAALQELAEIRARQMPQADLVLERLQAARKQLEKAREAMPGEGTGNLFPAILSDDQVRQKGDTAFGREIIKLQKVLGEMIDPLEFREVVR